MPTERAKADAQRDTADAAAALYFGEVMHARLKPMGHRFSYRVMSLLIDLDRLDEADRQSPLVRRQPGGALQLQRGRSRRSRRIALARLRATLRGGARHRPDRRARAAAVLSPAARLHLQSAVGLFLLSRRWRACACDLRGPQHFWRHPRLRAAGEAGRDQRRRRPASSRTSCFTSRPSSKWRCAIISGFRRRGRASNCASWKPTARAPCSPQPSMAAAAP